MSTTLSARLLEDLPLVSSPARRMRGLEYVFNLLLTPTTSFLEFYPVYFYHGD